MHDASILAEPVCGGVSLTTIVSSQVVDTAGDEQLPQFATLIQCGLLTEPVEARGKSRQPLVCIEDLRPNAFVTPLAASFIANGMSPNPLNLGYGGIIVGLGYPEPDELGWT